MPDPVPSQTATHADPPHEHVSSLASSVTIWGALIVCTALTAAAAFVDLGPLNTIVALTIATFKATLVVLFFMHVKYTHEKLTRSRHRQRDLLPVPPAVPKHGRLRHPSLALKRGSQAGLREKLTNVSSLPERPRNKGGFTPAIPDGHMARSTRYFMPLENASSRDIIPLNGNGVGSHKNSGNGAR